MYQHNSTGPTWMPLKSLNQFRYVREALVNVRLLWLRKVRGIKIPRGVSVSFPPSLLPASRGSIKIGEESLIAFKVILYTWDPVAQADRPIRIGRNCFIGGGSVITPGTTIEDGCIVAGGSVVFGHVPARTIVGGNPATTIRQNIEVMSKGRLPGSDEKTDLLYYGGKPPKRRRRN